MRREWLFEVNTACQWFIAVTFDANAATVEKAATEFRARVPESRHAIEQVFLRARLLECALRWAQDRHERLHPAGSECRTARVVVAKIAERWRAAGRCNPVDTCAAVVTWAARELEATHGQALAQSAASYIAARLASPLSMRELAMELAAHPSTIRRAFRREYRLTPGQYLRRLRVLRAAEMIDADGSEKVEAIARDVGWGSKRGLYQAWHRIKDGTPRRG